MCVIVKTKLKYLTYYYRITLHKRDANHCEVIKHCIKSKATLESSGDTANNNTIFENTTNLKTNLTSNATGEPNESSGIKPEMPWPMTNQTTKSPTDKPSVEPTKKPTEKRSTDIIDILIGSRRRRANRSKKVSHVITFNFEQIIIYNFFQCCIHVVK